MPLGKALGVGSKNTAVGELWAAATQAGTWTWELPAFRTVRNEGLPCKTSGLWHFTPAAGVDWDNCHLRAPLEQCLPPNRTGLWGPVIPAAEQLGHVQGRKKTEKQEPYVSNQVPERQMFSLPSLSWSCGYWNSNYKRITPNCTLIESL